MDYIKKIFVIIFGICLLGISYYGLSNNIYYIQIFMNLEQPYMYFRVAFVFILMGYAFMSWLRIYITRALLGISGFILLILGWLSVFSPTLLGRVQDYMLLGDSLALIEGGILSIVLSAELSARPSRFIARSYLYFKLFLTDQSRKFTYSPVLMTKTLKDLELRLKLEH